MLTTEDKLEIERLIEKRLGGAVPSIVDITARAIEVFGTREKALHWLNNPVRALEGNTPLSLLDTPEGIERVRTVLGQVEHGIW